jgi:hypothetical protein
MLSVFDDYCTEHFPSETELSRQVVREWIDAQDTNVKNKSTANPNVPGNKLMSIRVYDLRNAHLNKIRTFHASSIIDTYLRVKGSYYKPI